MSAREAETLPLDTGDDLVRIRQAVRKSAIEIGFNLVDQTKFVTAASEIARNALVHGGGRAHARLEWIADGALAGLRLTVEDDGKGIPDIPQALVDGFTSGSGMGLGLGGARRLVDEFEIVSQPGAGTRVILTRWRRGDRPGGSEAAGYPKSSRG